MLARHGIPVYAASTRPELESSSRWYEPVPGHWADVPLPENLQRCGLESAVLIPTSEAGSIAAASLPPELANRFPSSTAEPSVLRAFADKELTEQLLDRFGVARPRTWLVRTQEDLDAVGSQSLGDVFLKPRDSGRFSARFGRKSVRPKGREDLIEKLEELAAEGFEMVVQEFVPGPHTNSFLIDGFIDRSGEVKGIFGRQRVRQFPLDFGNSSAVRSVPRADVQELEATVTRLLKALSYRGIFNAEFKVDERDGTPRLLEINGRTWLYAEFASRCGFHAVRMAYADALGHDVAPCDEYDVGRLVIYPYYDLAACRALLRTGEIRPMDVVRSWRHADQLHYVPDDPRPALADLLQRIGDYAGRRVPWLQ